jgi:hypothetical protein
MRDTWSIKLFKNVLKIIFFSPELFFVIIMFLLKYLQIIPFDLIARKLFVNMEIVKWCTFACPCGILAFAFKFVKELLQPEENNKILYQWPEYDNYYITTIIGLIYCIVPILPTLISALNFAAYEEYDVGFYYIQLTGLSLISAVTMYLGKFTVKRIMQELS